MIDKDECRVLGSEGLVGTELVAHCLLLYVPGFTCLAGGKERDVSEDRNAARSSATGWFGLTYPECWLSLTGE